DGLAVAAAGPPGMAAPAGPPDVRGAQPAGRVRRLGAPRRDARRRVPGRRRDGGGDTASRGTGAVAARRGRQPGGGDPGTGGTRGAAVDLFRGGRVRGRVAVPVLPHGQARVPGRGPDDRPQAVRHAGRYVRARVRAAVRPGDVRAGRPRVDRGRGGPLMRERSAAAGPDRPDAPTYVGARRGGPGQPEGGAQRTNQETL